MHSDLELVYHLREDSREGTCQLLLDDIDMVRVLGGFRANSVLQLYSLLKRSLACLCFPSHRSILTSSMPSVNESSSSGRLRSSSTIFDPDTITSHWSSVATLNAELWY